MPPLTAEQHQHLLSIVLECLAGRDLEVLEDGWAVADKERGGVYGLVNLSQELDGVPQDAWPEIVRRRLHHLDSVSPDLPPTYELAAPRLRIRLSGNAADPGWAAHRKVCDGLDQILMMRNEVGCITVAETVVTAWGVSLDRAFADALERTIWDEPRERRVLARGELRLVWVRASFFASSLLLQLSHLLSPGNRFGALAMAPCRDALLFTEVNDARVVKAASGLIEVGSEWFVNGPGSITPDVFWIKPDGCVTRVVKAERGRYEPCWGGDFSEVLAELEQVSPTNGLVPAVRSQLRMKEKKPRGRH